MFSAMRYPAASFEVIGFTPPDREHRDSGGWGFEIHLSLAFARLCLATPLMPMYTKAMGFSLFEFNGKDAGDCVNALAFGIGNMAREPEEYKKLNPANGWGDYDVALAFLRLMEHTCRQHPLCRVRVT